MREGKLLVCDLKNRAEPGEMPKEKLVIVQTLFFKERTASFSRIYQADAVKRRFDKIVQVFNAEEVTGDCVVLEDGGQYHIDVCRPIKETEDFELTLIKAEKTYEVETSD